MWICGLSILAILSLSLQPVIFLNLAQVQRLRGDYASALGYLENVDASYPKNRNIQWRTAEVQFQIGQNENAFATLKPWLGQCGYSPLQAQFALLLLLDNGKYQDAINLYQCPEGRSHLAPGVAARLVFAFLQLYGALPEPIMVDLIGQAMGVTNPQQVEFATFATRVLANDIWHKELGKRIRQSVTWRSQSFQQTVNQQKVTAVTNFAQIAASMLEITPTLVTLTDNMALNGDIEQYNRLEDAPQFWSPTYMTFNSSWSNAAFIMGVDQVNQTSHALRIDGISSEPLPNRALAFAGFWHLPIVVSGQASFLVSFTYRTENTKDGSARLWVSYDPDVFFADDIAFPDTNGVWKRVYIIAWNHKTSKQEIQPLLRTSAEGTIWFDDFSLYKIELDNINVQQKLLIKIENANFN